MCFGYYLEILNFRQLCYGVYTTCFSYNILKVCNQSVSKLVLYTSANWVNMALNTMHLIIILAIYWMISWALTNRIHTILTYIYIIFYPIFIQQQCGEVYTLFLFGLYVMVLLGNVSKILAIIRLLHTSWKTMNSLNLICLIRALVYWCIAY